MIALCLAMLLACDADRAERAYRSGDFAAAMALYEAALAEPGAAEGPLLYNLGNCAFRLGRLPEAMLAYKRALLRLPGDPQARFNLSLVEQRLGAGEPAGDSLLAGALAAVDGLPPRRLLLVAALLESLGLLGFVLARRRRALRVTCALLVLVALLGAARLVQTQWFAGPPEAVVLAREVALRAEPHEEAATSLKLVAGEVVRVAERSERWARVVHARGSGWTERGGVGVVE
jgi:tetratricopeptide (TPR) repeat protein